MSVNDKGIVDTLKKCPENGFRMLMMKYQEPVYWHIRRLVVSHDDAQDASQETFVRIYRSFNQYRGDCSLRSWIYRYQRGPAAHQQTETERSFSGIRFNGRQSHPSR